MLKKTAIANSCTVFTVAQYFHFGATDEAVNVSVNK